MTPRNRTELVEVMARAMGLEELNEFWLDTAAAALTALENAGCVVVPKAATEEMFGAAYNHEAPEYRDDITSGQNAEAYRYYFSEPIYIAMVAASPYKEG